MREFMDTIATDLRVTHYPTYTDLRRYVDAVCGHNGLWVNALLSHPPHGTEHCAVHAIHASAGLQLTDYLRDLREDIEDGRCYLPLEDLDAFGISTDDLAEAARSGRMTEPLRELVRFEAERARLHFAQAADWWRSVHPSMRELPRLYVRLGQHGLERITRSGHDIFRATRTARAVCATASCAEFAAGYARAATRRLTARTPSGVQRAASREDKAGAA
ncbi:phytoene synthase [Saccharopolyspora erythraea D]|nr:phytoene synthase [Saccharopolyspora erythraea D]